GHLREERLVLALRAAPAARAREQEQDEDDDEHTGRQHAQPTPFQALERGRHPGRARDRRPRRAGPSLPRPATGGARRTVARVLLVADRPRGSCFLRAARLLPLAIEEVVWRHGRTRSPDADAKSRVRTSSRSQRAAFEKESRGHRQIPVTWRS